jgi:hypothetical protein
VRIRNSGFHSRLSAVFLIRISFPPSAIFCIVGDFTNISLRESNDETRDGLCGKIRLCVCVRCCCSLPRAAEIDEEEEKEKKEEKKRKKKIPAAISGLMVEIKEEVEEEEEEVYSGGGGIKRRQQQRILPKAKKRISPHCLSLSMLGQEKFTMPYIQKNIIPR